MSSSDNLIYCLYGDVGGGRVGGHPADHLVPLAGQEGAVVLAPAPAAAPTTVAAADGYDWSRPVVHLTWTHRAEQNSVFCHIFGRNSAFLF